MAMKVDRRAVDTHVAYLSDALASDDLALVALAMKEIGIARRIPVMLDENPSLGDAVRAARELGFNLMALRSAP